MAPKGTPQAALSDYVVAELATEWQRKSSIETRALGVVTLNLSLLTLFLAARTQLDLGDALSKNPSKALALIAIAAVAASVAAAVVAAWPRAYPTGDPEVLAQLRELINAGRETDIEDQVLETRIEQLRQAVGVNQSKGNFAIAAFVSAGAAAASLIAALTTASI